MTQEDIEKKLNYLLDRQAIYDVIARYARGVDRLDKELVISVYHEDAIDDHSMFVGGREEFWNWMQNMHFTHHSSTQHMIGNHLAEIDGDTAHAETYFFWSGMNREGAPYSAMGGRYIDRLEKRNGQWAIVARNSITDWAAPSVNTVEGAKTPEGGPNLNCLEPFEFKVMEGAPKSSRDAHDPSYRRPLIVSEARQTEYLEIKSRSA